MPERYGDLEGRSDRRKERFHVRTMRADRKVSAEKVRKWLRDELAGYLNALEICGVLYKFDNYTLYGDFDEDLGESNDDAI